MRRRLGVALPRGFWAQIPAGLSLRPFGVASHVLVRERSLRSDPLKLGTVVVYKTAVGLEIMSTD